MQFAGLKAAVDAKLAQKQPGIPVAVVTSPPAPATTVSGAPVTNTISGAPVTTPAVTTPATPVVAAKLPQLPQPTLPVALPAVEAFQPELPIKEVRRSSMR